jgi:hypothetical protein
VVDGMARKKQGKEVVDRMSMPTSRARASTLLKYLENETTACLEARMWIEDWISGSSHPEELNAMDVWLECDQPEWMGWFIDQAACEYDNWGVLRKEWSHLVDGRITGMLNGIFSFSPSIAYDVCELLRTLVLNPFRDGNLVDKERKKRKEKK